MSWNYRIIKRTIDGSFGLHEVYYHEDGRPRAFTLDATGFVANDDEGPEGVIWGLERALADARSKPVLIEAEAFPETNDEPQA